MWGRRGEGLGDSGLDQLRRHRLIAEAAHRAAQQLGLPATHVKGFGGAEPEQVLFAGRSRCRAVEPSSATG